jgi:hypothetical protein
LAIANRLTANDKRQSGNGNRFVDPSIVDRRLSIADCRLPIAD